MKLKLPIWISAFAWPILALISVLPAAPVHAAAVNCLDNQVHMNTGDTCTVNVDYIVSWSGVGDQAGNATVTGKSGSITFSWNTNGTVSAGVCQSGMTGTVTMKVNKGSAWLKFSKCGGGDGGGGGSPFGDLGCTGNTQTSIDWAYDWGNVANKPVTFSTSAGYSQSYNSSNGEDQHTDDGLTPNTTYTATLKDSKGGTLASGSCTTDSRPAPTGSISCKNITDTSITIHYRYANVRRVRIFRKVAGGAYNFFYQAESSPGDTPPDTGLAPGTAYTYKMTTLAGTRIGQTVTCRTTGNLPVARLPFLTSVWCIAGSDADCGGINNQLRTYGDIHAGGRIKTTGVGKKKIRCNSTDPNKLSAEAVHGTYNASAVSSVISATGGILGFGAGGLTDPNSPLHIGQSKTLDKNYMFPICQLDVVSLTDYVGTEGFSHWKKGKHISRYDNDETNTHVLFIGSKSSDDDACGNKDRALITTLLGDDGSAAGHEKNKDLMIWCYVHVAVPANVPLNCVTFDHQQVCNNPGAYGDIDYNQPFALSDVTVRGHKTLVVEAIPIRTSCSGGCHPVPNNGYTVKISGNVRYDSSPKSNVADLPSFALATNAGITIRGNVDEMDGYYFAGLAGAKLPQCRLRNYNGHRVRGCFKGYIRTCTVNPTKGASNSCNNRLDIRGLLSANAAFFWRTGDGTTATGAVASERVGGPEIGLVFVGAEPPGLASRDLGSNCADNCTLEFEQNEQPPLF